MIRYILASQCGEWIFNGLLGGAHKEYVVLLCTIFRLLASPLITDSVIRTLSNLERRFQVLHRQLLPPIAAPLFWFTDLIVNRRDSTPTQTLVGAWDPN